jgi:hypothetical protein
VKGEKSVGEKYQQGGDGDQGAHELLHFRRGLKPRTANICDVYHMGQPLYYYSSSSPGVRRSMKWPKAEAIGLAGSSCQAWASKATTRRPCLTIDTRA